MTSRMRFAQVNAGRVTWASQRDRENVRPTWPPSAEPPESHDRVAHGRLRVESLGGRAAANRDWP